MSKPLKSKSDIPDYILQPEMTIKDRTMLEYSEFTNNRIFNMIKDLSNIYNMIIDFTFDTIGNDIKRRTLYVLFEPLLQCDPSKDHKTPKNVYPVFEPFLDYARVAVKDIQKANLTYNIEKLVTEVVEKELILRLQAEQLLMHKNSEYNKQQLLLQAQDKNINLLLGEVGDQRSMISKVFETAKQTIAAKTATGMLYVPDHFKLGADLKKSNFDDCDIESSDKQLRMIANLKRQLDNEINQKRLMQKQIDDLQKQLKAMQEQMVKYKELSNNYNNLQAMFDQMKIQMREQERIWDDIVKQKDYEISDLRNMIDELNLQIQQLQDYIKQLESLQNNNNTELSNTNKILNQMNNENQYLKDLISQLQKQLKEKDEKEKKLLQNQVNKQQLLEKDDEIERLRKQLQELQEQQKQYQNIINQKDEKPQSIKEIDQIQVQKQNEKENDGIGYNFKQKNTDFNKLSFNQLLQVATSCKNIIDEITGQNLIIKQTEQQINIIFDQNFQSNYDTIQQLSQLGINSKLLNKSQYLFLNKPEYSEFSQYVGENEILTTLQQSKQANQNKQSSQVTNNKQPNQINNNNNNKQQDNNAQNKLDNKQNEQLKQINDMLENIHQRSNKNANNNNNDPLQQNNLTHLNYGKISKAYDVADEILNNAKRQAIDSLDQYVDVGIQVPDFNNSIDLNQPDAKIKALRAQNIINRLMQMTGITIKYRQLELYDDIPEVFLRLYNNAKEIRDKQDFLRQQYESETALLQSRILESLRLTKSQQQSSLSVSSKLIANSAMLRVQTLDTNDKKVIPLYQMDCEYEDQQNNQQVSGLKVNQQIKLLQKNSQNQQVNILLNNQSLKNFTQKQQKFNQLNDSELMDVLFDSDVNTLKREDIVNNKAMRQSASLIKSKSGKQ